jgi:Zn-finger nucleic acid-binding protein
MICPVCKTDMVVVEYHGIELDFCTLCEGVWFDAGELELVFKTHRSEQEIDTFFTDMMKKPNAGAMEKVKKCPLCGRKMDKKDIGDSPHILIDACGKGHGLWFDGGEVVQFAEYMRNKEGHLSDSNNMAIEFLEEFFGTPE